MTRFRDLPVGAHFRIKSRMRDGVTLPTVRVKVTEEHYTVLGRSYKHLGAAAMVIVPVPAKERATGER